MKPLSKPCCCQNWSPELSSTVLSGNLGIASLEHTLQLHRVDITLFWELSDISSDINPPGIAIISLARFKTCPDTNGLV
jgi:hypothetical protein